MVRAVLVVTVNGADAGADGGFAAGDSRPGGAGGRGGHGGHGGGGGGGAGGIAVGAFHYDSTVVPCAISGGSGGAGGAGGAHAPAAVLADRDGHDGRSGAPRPRGGSGLLRIELELLASNRV